MRNTLVLLLFSLLPAVALAQEDHPAPKIRSITPNSGPESGGTIVLITGTNFDLPPGVACILPCPPEVTFGEKKVQADAYTNEQITVVAPPNEPGPVPITIQVLARATLKIENGFTYTRSSESAYERVLIPVYFDGRISGAHGAIFETELWIRNAGTAPVQLAPWSCPEMQICPAVFPLTRTLSPGESLRGLAVFFRAPVPNAGRLLYVTRDGAGEVVFNLRAADKSRSATNAGTEVPVVREDDLLIETANLLNVPFENQFRQTLRVYDADQPSASFRVRVFEMQQGASGSLLLEHILEAETRSEGPFNDIPAYAQIANISAIIPTGGPRPAAVRVEVEPLSGSGRFWAFVSVTNNETQHVTIVTPQ
jgi:hypothetical protein